MNKENGFAYQILILIVIIIIAIAGVLINKIIGKDGIIEQATLVEEEFSKEDILEKLNFKITQKFIELNNIAKENNQNISEIYNANVVIEFLKQNVIIEEIFDDDGNVKEGVYNINIQNLKEDDEDETPIGTFKLEKRDENYIVVYYDEDNNSQDIGNLQIQQTM